MASPEPLPKSICQWCSAVVAFSGNAFEPLCVMYFALFPHTVFCAFPSSAPRPSKLECCSAVSLLFFRHRLLFRYFSSNTVPRVQSSKNEVPKTKENPSPLISCSNDSPYLVICVCCSVVLFCLGFALLILDQG